MNRIASPAQLRASFLRWALFLVPAITLAGFLSGRAAGSGPGNPWFDGLVKPAIFPPPATFGIVWTVLYIMMGLSLALICAARGARGRGLAILLFILQLALNLAWSPVFFGAHQITYGLVIIGLLDVMVLLTIFAVWRVRRAAAVLLLPYLAWVLFATVLNYQFLIANPDADGAEGSHNAVQRITL
ncbi:tryptophan-rich sensory protein [Altericroceibacterium spongiae]|uniref:Tryptophan-rich sensory protein n=1 Tax=Altericroceibacterium spongiae TaxID=2320269 RepID=A0A420EMF2_9SPHN|nr:TspO/MBR family protein [Altericroceibacterium spongiae]RKF21858.1 tryptophan-rich sensory protein [Altericroceibacterium spongiae]